MKFLFDLLPVILFFAAFKLGDIYIATGVAIVATLCQVAWVWFRHKKVDTMLWVSLLLVVVFGGATLFLHDETFIKLKPTLLYWIFAAALLISTKVFKKDLMRAMLGEKFQMEEAGWRQLNALWTGFFLFMGLANLYVAHQFATETWVNFKLFGGMGLMLVFVLAQGIFLARHMKEEK